MKDHTLQQKTYILENLGCANCAAKMEHQIRQLPDIEEVTLTFATKQLKITAADPASLEEEIQHICRSIESGVHLTERAEGRASANDQKAVPCSKKTHSGFFKQYRSEIIILILGAALFAGGLILEHIDPAIISGAAGAVAAADIILFSVFAAAYLLLGYEVLLTAFRNITHGQVFDENFLMSIATIAAFCIGEFAEGAGVMLFYRVGELFEHIAVERSRSQIMEAVDMRPETVTLIQTDEQHQHSDVCCECGHEQEAHCECEHEHHREHEEFCCCSHERDHTQGDCCDTAQEHVHTESCKDYTSAHTIPAAEAVPGDLLLIRPGDRIPLDGIVAEGESRIDTSPVTGEPVPAAVRPGSQVISGCINQQGLLKIQVTQPLSTSMVTKILDAVENAAAGKPRIDKFITRFARIYTPIVVTLAVLTAVIPSLFTGEWMTWITTAITFLVISCPCALVISVPLAFFSGIGAASKLGILFKGGLAIEALKNVKAIVLDKTGTITKGIFAVNSISPFGDMSENDLLALAAACESASSHPVAISITEKARQAGLSIEKPAAVQELAGMGIKARLREIPGTDGRANILHIVLCGNRRLMEAYDVNLLPLAEATETPEVSGASGTEVLIAVDGSFAGRIIISDQLKDDSIAAVKKLKDMGLVPAMLTGDNMESAADMAAASGITNVRAGLLPEEKVHALKELRDELGAVMFVGDGINDAPVLAGADVGAAMGSGADAAIEAADVVFMTSSLAAVPQSIAIARRVGRIAVQNIVFALGIKLLVILLGFAGFANIWAAVFADTGVAILCILNSLRLLIPNDRSKCKPSGCAGSEFLIK